MNRELGTLYDQKRVIVEKMEAQLEQLKRSGEQPTIEQNSEFDKWDKELIGIARQIDLITRIQQEKAEHVLRTGERVGGGEDNEERKFTPPGSESFSTPKGKELPVFNRSNPLTVREWYQRDHSVSEDLKGVSFGQLVRAHLFGPRSEKEERALAEGTPSAGGYTVPTIVAADFVDRLRPAARVLQSGANIVTIDDRTNKYSIAKLINGLTVQWMAENAQQSPADPTFGQVLFEFKTVRSLCVMSNELLQDSLNIERVISTEAVRAFASELDRVALVGSGVGAEPGGIITYTDKNVITLNDQLENYDSIVDLMTAIQSDNAQDPTAAIMHPRTLGSFAKLKDQQDQPLQRPDLIRNIPFYQTTSIPITDGTPGNQSKIFMGDWSQLYFGMRLGVTIQPLKERYADYNQTGFLIVMRADVQPYHEESFGYVQQVHPGPNT